jgi:hypothetical protein
MYPPWPLLPDGVRPAAVGASPYRLPEQWKLLPFLALPGAPACHTHTHTHTSPWCSLAPRCAAPDGVHNAEADVTYFVLPPSDNVDLPCATPLFGVACYRHMDASVRRRGARPRRQTDSDVARCGQALAVRTADVQRNRVQKAVVVLSRVVRRRPNLAFPCGAH